MIVCLATNPQASPQKHKGSPTKGTKHQMDFRVLNSLVLLCLLWASFVLFVDLR
jgi:hypothetical protein